MNFDKVILKFVWRGKRPIRANTTLKGQNKVGKLSLPEYKTCYAANHNSMVLVKEQTNTPKEQNKESKIDPRSQLKKEAKAINGAKIVFTVNAAGTTGHSHAKNNSRYRPNIFHKK